MTIQLDGTIVSTTMRTPGHDFELAVGFCHTEGLLARCPDPRREVLRRWPGDRHRVQRRHGRHRRSCAHPDATARYHVVELRLVRQRAARRDVRAPRHAAGDRTDAARSARVTARTRRRREQRLFDATGAVHAAAVFDRDGDIRLVREDVGRHNAVDKVVGAMLLADELPATGLGLFVSGRASVEMVQKAWAAGFGTVVAVSAPTALAVDAARRAGLCLVGLRAWRPVQRVRARSGSRARLPEPCSVACAPCAWKRASASSTSSARPLSRSTGVR